MYEDAGSSTLTDKCIILDLDETLVYTQEDLSDLFQLKILDDPMLMRLRGQTYLLDIEDATTARGQGQLMTIWGTMRPHLKEFLSFCFHYFRFTAVWSAGTLKYVDAISDHIFRDLPSPAIIYSWPNCVHMDNNLLKPIVNMIANEDKLRNYMTLANTFILDDRSTTFAMNLQNGILIPSWHPFPSISGLQMDDTALIKLMNWFIQPEVINASDVRLLDKFHIFD